VLNTAERQEEKIDTNTRLPTRSGLERIFGTLLDTARGEGKSLCLLMLTVDQYDNVVSSYGSSFARQFLDCVAQRLSRVLEGDEFLGHDTAGTFLLLISAGDPAERIMLVDHKLDELLSTPVHVDRERSLALTLSIGASVAEGKPTFDELVDQTHAAMITGRERGGATIQLYQPHLVAEFRGQLELESELRRALADKAFELYYQPQVDVSSGQISGLEALLRWRHPQQGFISPAVFIPVAERLGLIDEIGSWVLGTALRQFAVWQRAGEAPEEIAVNVSAKQMKRLEFVERVRTILEETGVRPMNLVLEITESAAIEESDAIASCLEALRGLGVVLAVDDFGTGYANLGNLTRFSFRKLKIDRSLLPRSPKDQRAMRLYANIVAMATELDMTVIAEGVETPSELAAVHGAGCRIVQGYFYSPPLSVDELSALLCGPLRLQG
jgi:diguanylate cyclase (GGDEF)-like protein